jgi:uncharacterized protein (TIGR02598 family)
MRRRDGFTLLEVLIALALLTVGIVAAMQLFPYSLRQTRAAAERTAAAHLADSQISRLRAMDIGQHFNQWLIANTGQQADAANDLYSGWSATAQRTGINTDTYRVTFSVQMLDGRRENFVTYITRR